MKHTLFLNYLNATATLTLNRHNKNDAKGVPMMPRKALEILTGGLKWGWSIDTFEERQAYRNQIAANNATKDRKASGSAPASSSGAAAVPQPAAAPRAKPITKFANTEGL